MVWSRVVHVDRNYGHVREEERNRYTLSCCWLSLSLIELCCDTTTVLHMWPGKNILARARSWQCFHIYHSLYAKLYSQI